MTSKSTTIAAYSHHPYTSRNPREACGCVDRSLPQGSPAHDGSRVFYVTVTDAGRTGWLLGPYSTHEEALDNVERGRALALQADRWAHFYGFGTCSVSNTAPIARTVFGS